MQITTSIQLQYGTALIYLLFYLYLKSAKYSSACFCRKTSHSGPLKKPSSYEQKFTSFKLVRESFSEVNAQNCTG